MNDFFYAFVSLFTEMAPYLLLGFLLAGVLHVWVPKSLYIPKISKANFKSVVWSALFGIPLPICSCGVIPTVISLRQDGASRGASVSFLISTPATGVDSILATYSIMGFPFAILRPIAAFVTSILGGVLTNLSTKNEDESFTKAEPVSSCCSSHPPEPVEEISCCSSKDSEKANPQTSVWAKLQEMWTYGFVDLVQNISKWLLVGLVFGALISAFIPDDFFLGLRDYPFLSSLLVLAIAMPMYTCATGSIPLALALVAKGLTPGAALVLLMAGPATSVASMLVIGKNFGKRTLFTYLAGISIGALFFGWLIDSFFMEFFLNSMLLDGHFHGEGHHISLLNSLSGVFLAALMLYSFKPQKKHQEESSCGCG